MPPSFGHGIDTHSHLAKVSLCFFAGLDGRKFTVTAECGANVLAVDTLFDDVRAYSVRCNSNCEPPQIHVSQEALSAGRDRCVFNRCVADPDRLIARLCRHYVGNFVRTSAGSLETVRRNMQVDQRFIKQSQRTSRSLKQPKSPFVISRSRVRLLVPAP